MNQGNGSQNCQASSRKMVYFAAGWNLRFAEPIIELILFELFFSHAYTPGQKEKLGYASRLFLGTHCPQRSTSCPEISDTWASKTERFFIQKYINHTYNYIRLIAANCKSLSVTFEVRDWNYAFAITFKFRIMSCQKEGKKDKCKPKTSPSASSSLKDQRDLDRYVLVLVSGSYVIFNYT